VKTQIIQIEPHDDSISVKDKMGWGQTPRILLVWPRKTQILNRRLDLVNLKRHCASLGAQLAFVTKDSNIRYYAEMLDIPIYPNIRKAEESHWRSPRRRRKGKPYPNQVRSAILSPESIQRHKSHLNELRRIAYPEPTAWLIHPITRLILFTLGVLGVLAIAAVLLPSAEIRITPKTQWERVLIPVVARLDAESVALSGMIPAQDFTLIVEGRGVMPTTGSIAIPDKNAEGKVVFTNLTELVINIPASTIVSTIGNETIRFTTLEIAKVSPTSDSDLIPIKAVLPGKSGNVLSNHIIAIEGPLGLDLTVTNPIATSHGTDQTSPAPSEKDFQSLLDKVLAELHQTALIELTSRLDPNDLVLQADPTNFDIIEEIYTPANIQPADQLHLTLRVAFQTYVATGKDLRELGQSVLEANLPERFSPVPSTLDLEHKSKPGSEDGNIFKWDMQAKWQVEASFDVIDAITLVLWRKPDDAIKQLAVSLPIDPDLSITLTPKWWPRLPILPFRVAVINSP
jgi:hypothetical protein